MAGADGTLGALEAVDDENEMKFGVFVNIVLMGAVGLEERRECAERHDQQTDLIVVPPRLESFGFSS